MNNYANVQVWESKGEYMSDNGWLTGDASDRQFIADCGVEILAYECEQSWRKNETAK
jgi:hypothetical protein